MGKKARKIRGLEGDALAQALEADLRLKNCAEKKAGGTGKLAKRFGVTSSAVSQWGVAYLIPRHLHERVEEYVLDSPPEQPAAVSEPRPGYLRQEAHEIRCFTSLVEALQKIEREKLKIEEGRIYQAAWRVVMAAAETVRLLADWQPADWKATVKMDHWKTLTMQPEDETIRKAIRS